METAWRDLRRRLEPGGALGWVTRRMGPLAGSARAFRLHVDPNPDTYAQQEGPAPAELADDAARSCRRRDTACLLGSRPRSRRIT